MKIDMVYLWVDGNDKKWLKQKNKWEKIQKKSKGLSEYASGKARFRDNGEFLYSLRSVAKYAPWVNHIYIITGFNQVPKWLNTKNPKITIVPHEKIFPKDALPIFNSTAIEMCISNIPNLAEHFLLMNDDIFFNRRLKPNFFFDKKGRAKVSYSSGKLCDKNGVIVGLEQLDEYTQSLVLSTKMIQIAYGKKFYNRRPSHGIDPYIKSSMIECKNNPIFKKQIGSQIYNKFRTNDEIQRWTFNLYDLVHKRAKFIHSRATKHTRHKVLNFIYNTIFYFQTKRSPVYCEDVLKAQKALLRAAQFCINDSENLSEEIIKNNTKFLQKCFPKKSPFEK